MKDNTGESAGSLLVVNLMLTSPDETVDKQHMECLKSEVISNPLREVCNQASVEGTRGPNVNLFPLVNCILKVVIVFFPFKL